MDRTSTALLTAAAAGIMALMPTGPASASVPRPDLPCNVVVPTTVVLGAQGGAITGRRGTCPALLKDPSWEFLGPDGTSAFSLMYDADAVYPTRDMTQKIYAFQGPGRYRLAPQQTELYEDPSVGEYGEYYEVPLTASNDVVAKFSTSIAVSVSHRGAGATRTTTVTVRGRRAAAYESEGAAGQGFRVQRDGVQLRSGVLSASGVATWTFRDRTGAHTYGATLPETSRTWSAKARAVRG